MLKSIEMTGANRDIAIQKALDFLQMDRDDVSVEVLDNGQKGFFGFGSTDAKVRVTYEVPDEPAEQPAPKAGAEGCACTAAESRRKARGGKETGTNPTGFPRYCTR